MQIIYLVLNIIHKIINIIFLGTLPTNKLAYEALDDDGLPAVGTLLQEGDIFYRYYNYVRY